LQKAKSNEKLITVLFFGAIFLIYLLFPSHNNSGDAWSMAADVKFGNELFSPHHLLYTATVYAIQQVFHVFDILWLGIACNSFFAVFALIVLFQILNLLDAKRVKNLLLTAAVAFSFGFWRFATENETYIIPIFFSLLGSLFFIKAYKEQATKSSYILLSGLFATIACLYHQIHIFWFAGLFFGWLFFEEGKYLKRGLLFASTFLIAPLSYFLVIIFYLHQHLNWFTITHFVFHDYYIGAAGNHFGFRNIFLGAINFIRTFFQVHGQMGIIISKYPLWLLPGILSLGLILFATVQFFKGKDLTTFKKLSNLNIVANTHMLIFALQLIFAIYNIGNAEFMVMLPALAAIILAGTNMLPQKAIAYFSMALLIWNFFYGIFPNHYFHFNADDKITQFIIDHPDDKFVVAEPAIVLNQYYYQKGHWPANTWAGPGYYELHGTITELKAKVDSTLKSGNKVYTDCTGRPETASRGSMVYGSSTFFDVYNIKDTASVFKTDAGKHFVFRVTVN